MKNMKYLVLLAFLVLCGAWEIDISEALKAGGNKLEIEVANLWPNRLIGDATLLPEDRLTLTIEKHPYKADSQLMPSGLIGSVEICHLQMKSN